MPETSKTAILNLGLLINHINDEIVAKGLLEPSDKLLKELNLELAEPIDWQLTVSNTGGDNEFLVEGELKGKSIMECRRCLEPSPAKVDTDFVYQLEFKAGVEELKFSESEDLNELLVFGKPIVDFAGFISEIFTMSQPLTNLCKEDCRGLNNDGVNLNFHPEAAKEKVVEISEKESPFASLKDFEV